MGETYDCPTDAWDEGVGPGGIPIQEPTNPYEDAGR